MKPPKFTRDEALLLISLYFELASKEDYDRRYFEQRVSVYSAILRKFNDAKVELSVCPEFRNTDGLNLQLESIKYYHMSILGLEPHGIKNSSTLFKNLLMDVLNNKIDISKERLRILEKIITECNFDISSYLGDI